jgi:hypothetical protein
MPPMKRNIHESATKQVSGVLVPQTNSLERHNKCLIDH